MIPQDFITLKRSIVTCLVSQKECSKELVNSSADLLRSKAQRGQVRFLLYISPPLENVYRTEPETIETVPDRPDQFHASAGYGLR